MVITSGRKQLSRYSAVKYYSEPFQPAGLNNLISELLVSCFWLTIKFSTTGAAANKSLAKIASGRNPALTDVVLDTPIKAEVQVCTAIRSITTDVQVYIAALERRSEKNKGVRTVFFPLVVALSAV